jgi:hypothetical protein
MSSAWRRGFDQLERLGMHHSALVEAVTSASVWAIAAEGRREGTDARLWMLGFAYELNLLASDMRFAGVAWAGSLGDADQSVAFLQPQFDSGTTPSAVPPLRRAVTAATTSRCTRPTGDYLEGQRLLRTARHYRVAWMAEVVDAAHFLEAADITIHDLLTYIQEVKSAAKAAVRQLELAYMTVVEATYRPMLASTASGALGTWMLALADGGIKRNERELVLSGFPADYSDAVTTARRATAHRD